MHDVNRYYGTAQPAWAPTLTVSFEAGQLFPARDWYSPRESVFVIDNALSPEGCQELIAQFDLQDVKPVGVNGYANDIEHAGSFRAQAWSPEIGEKINTTLRAHLPHMLIDWCRSGEPTGDLHEMIDLGISLPSPVLKSHLTLLGSTPWLRFMRYPKGGKHVPHHDAPYENTEEQYVTLFSWVLYLNTLPEEHGGGFQFVDDGHTEHPAARIAGKAWNDAFADWVDMAEPNQIKSTIQPVQGRLIAFPHWLCHQVQEYTGPGQRYIIRGDVAYKFKA